jgi:hypothetical protein
LKGLQLRFSAASPTANSKKPPKIAALAGVPESPNRQDTCEARIKFSAAVSLTNLEDAVDAKQEEKKKI